jgi:A/G-specific adenine glycosylase
MLLAAKMIVADFRGVFPREKRLLETIPGIGPYTASAILSFAYGENHIAWDTNVKRVIGRFFFGNGREDFSRAPFERRLALPAKTLSAALMDFGSALCLARPRCEACPLRTRCVYDQEKGANESRAIPRSKTGDQKTDWKEAHAVVFLHENHRKYFSASGKKYAPFILPKGYVTRADVKKWFMKKYNLTVSVRPPHGKVVSGRKRILFVNAQILSGDHPFACFPKNAREEYTGGSPA